MAYKIMGAFFPIQGRCEAGEKDFKDKLISSWSGLDPFINGPFTKTIVVYKIFDPYPKQIKDLILIVKKNSGDIETYRFPEQGTGRKVTIILP